MRRIGDEPGVAELLTNLEAVLDRAARSENPSRRQPRGEQPLGRNAEAYCVGNRITPQSLTPRYTAGRRLRQRQVRRDHLYTVARLQHRPTIICFSRPLPPPAFLATTEALNSCCSLGLNAG